MNELKEGLDDEFYKECSDFIKRVRESKYTKILDRQKNKFNRSCQHNKDGHSNNRGGCSKNKNDNQQDCSVLRSEPTAMM